MRFFLVCPAEVVTGGTELLHQFSRCLSDCGIANYMLYPNADGVSCPTPITFLKYGAKYVSEYVDADDTVLVLTETQIHLADTCKKGIAMIWWLSVDNYFYNSIQYFKKNVFDSHDADVFELRQRKNVIHFVQSYYAEDFVKRIIGIGECFFLQDYINDEIVQIAGQRRNAERQNICLYNPKKGLECLQPVMDACREDIQWIPLKGLQPSEMAELMCRAKLYVDFGSHPGKDRIPRESAICGCCVLTNRKGSAAYAEDVAIPECYKLNDTGDIGQALDVIYELVDHYDEHIDEFEEYRRRIAGEKQEFLMQMQSALRIVADKVGENMESPETFNGAEYADILQSMGRLARQMEQITVAAGNMCSMGDKGGAMDQLLTLDYLISVMRESVYAELVRMIG